MRSIEFPPLGRKTSRIGLGCGRLVGRSSFRASARVVEKALDLGIRYFDVAPSYGLGTADEVLGEVLGDSHEVIVATKVGVPRPIYSAKADLARRMAKTVLDRVAPLKKMILGARGSNASDRPRYDFSDSAIRASIEESLRKLRRASVDVFLAHEPHPSDLDGDLAARFERLRQEGMIAAYGVGIGAKSDRWSPFGSIWQSAWPGSELAGYSGEVQYIWHGAIRGRGEGPSSPRPAAAAVRLALDASPHSVLLVSASTPARLAQLLDEVEG